MILVTAKQMQEMDRKTITEFGIPGLVLMENAGRGALEMLVDTFEPIAAFRVAVVAGRGNNGGDGFVMGRYLMEMGVRVSFVLLSDRDRVAGDARINMELAEALLAEHPDSQFMEVPDQHAFDRLRENILDHDLFVDAILGTGLTSDVKGFFKEVIQTLNGSDGPYSAWTSPRGSTRTQARSAGWPLRPMPPPPLPLPRPAMSCIPAICTPVRLKSLTSVFPAILPRLKVLTSSFRKKTILPA